MHIYQGPLVAKGITKNNYSSRTPLRFFILTWVTKPFRKPGIELLNDMFTIYK